MKLTAARPNPELQLRASSTRARFFLKYCPSIAVLLSRIIQMPNAERHNFKHLFIHKYPIKIVNFYIEIVIINVFLRLKYVKISTTFIFP